MDRRKSIKTLVVGGFSIGVVAEACKLHENSPVVPSEKDKETYRFRVKPDEGGNRL